MAQALTQAKTARLGILEQMVQVLPTPRSQLSPFAPRISTIKINPDKIREVIGKGGATIQSITKERSEEHTSELQSLMRISYAVFCLKTKKQKATCKLLRKSELHTTRVRWNKRSSSE